MHQAFRAAIAREWKDQWRWAGGLALGFTLLVLMVSRRDGAGLTPLAAAAAVLPPFAAAALPASVVDDAASGLVRLVATQPLPRGAYALLRATSAATLLVGVTLPILLALAAWTGDWDGAARAVLVLPLAAAWSAAGGVLVGLLANGSAAATAWWLAITTLNLQMALTVLSGTQMDDMLLRARHALPAGPAAEAVMPADPWALGAPLVLGLEAALLFALAWRHAARGWRQAEASPGQARATLAAGILLALLLPFVLPSELEVPR